MQDAYRARRHLIVGLGALALVAASGAVMLYRRNVEVMVFPHSCAVCGSEILRNWQRCPCCGTLLTTATTQPTHPVVRPTPNGVR